MILIRSMYPVRPMMKHPILNYKGAGKRSNKQINRKIHVKHTSYSSDTSQYPIAGRIEYHTFLQLGISF